MNKDKTKTELRHSAQAQEKLIGDSVVTGETGDICEAIFGSHPGMLFLFLQRSRVLGVSPQKNG